MLLYSYEQFFNDEYTYVNRETQRKLDEYLTLLEVNNYISYIQFNKLNY